MSNRWVYVTSRVRPTGQSAVSHWRNFNVGHDAQTSQPGSFIPDMRTGTIDSNHFTPLSVTLGLAGGTKQTCWLYFLSHFSTEWDEIWNGDEEIEAQPSKTTFE